jgi:hypothetical protein
MDLRRLRAGEWLLAGAGALLLVSLFLPWYGVSDGAATRTGFEAFAVLDVVLALIAAGAVAVLPVTAAQRVSAVPLALQSLITVAGLVALVLVLVRVLNLPGDATGREWALWMGLAGAAGVVVGGLVAMRDERPSPPGAHVDLTGRPVARPPEVETLPAPRPDAPG